MVFSDDFLHFLKIKKKMSWIHQNYLVALIYYKLSRWYSLQLFFFYTFPPSTLLKKDLKSNETYIGLHVYLDGMNVIEIKVIKL